MTHNHLFQGNDAKRDSCFCFIGIERSLVDLGIDFSILSQDGHETDGDQIFHIELELKPSDAERTLAGIAEYLAALGGVELVRHTRPDSWKLIAFGIEADTSTWWRATVILRPETGKVGLASQRPRQECVSVAFIGPDGTGKSSVIDALQRFFGDKQQAPVAVHHVRPRWLPPIGEAFSILKSRQRRQSTKGEAEFGGLERPPSGTLGSLVRLAWLFVDYRIGGQIIMSRHKRNGIGLVIFDRFTFDILLSPRKFRVQLPEALRRRFVRAIPNPQLTFFLRAPGSTIYARKPELPIHEIERQLELMIEIAGQVPGAVLLNSDTSIRETRNSVLTHLHAVFAAQHMAATRRQSPQTTDNPAFALHSGDV